MLRNQITHRTRYVFSVVLIILFAVSFGPAIALADNPPVRCAGYGELKRISLTNWDAGLESWTVRTHRTAIDFDTPDWAAIGNLPDSRPGLAAFVADQDNGDCATEDKSGALWLESPSVVIPGGAQVPRISIEHWFETEFGWDGGNLKISVNDGEFNLVPVSAIEFGSYSGTLFQKVKDSAPYNTNPLAEEKAFTGTNGELDTGSWGSTYINLLDIAGAGDTIKLRFDFGVDQCGGVIGWYVDDVEFYYCEAELPPSDCGNRVIDAGEQCDDGNNFIDDGCSNICQIEEGWQCTAPNLPSFVPDHSFEAGTPNPFWTEVSNNGFDTPICEASRCGTGGGVGPADGTYWLWFGGTRPGSEGSVSQEFVIPSTEEFLAFDLEIPTCDSAQDYVEVLIDGVQGLVIDGSSALCGVDGYSVHSLDISDYADDQMHEIEFHSETFAVNNSVTNFFIDVVALPGTPSKCRRSGTHLTLLKSVKNNDGGSAQASDWTLMAAGPTGFSGTGPVVWSGDAFGEGFQPGTYNLSESGNQVGYNASSWDCDGATQVDDDTVTIALGEAATCTITNDDVAPSLTLVKEVTNNNGGNALASAWTLTATGPTGFSGSGPIVSSGAGFRSGSYVLSETGGTADYTASNWICDGGAQVDNTITLALGEAATCTIINDDNGPGLTLIKQIVKDNGGTASASDWTLTATGPTGFSGSGPSISNGADFSAGTYDLSESGPAGYTASAWVCDGGTQEDADTITLALGETANCTITNDDIAPGLTLVKAVTNNNGGTAVPSDWMLSASGPTSFSGMGPSVSNKASFDAGSYNLSESGGPSYYTASAWACDGGNQINNTITLALGETVTCTITNDDTAPILNLVKEVTNDNGGLAGPADWILTATGPTGFSGSGSGVSSDAAFEPGSYNLSESGPAGYSAGDWDCVGDGTHVDNTITLALGETATCTIANDDIAPSLTLAKEVINNNGGTELASAWTLTAAGPTGFSGFGPSVSNGISFDAGRYDLSESGPVGYIASAWTCNGGTQDDGDTITLALGEVVTCTIVNDDASAGLTLIKEVVNDNGGSAQPSAWTLHATGPTGFSGSGPSVSSGGGFAPGTYNLSETGGSNGYNASGWVCDTVGDVIHNGDTITLGFGGFATCTITNDDAAPSLTLEKVVIINNGGTAVEEDWTLTATGPTTFGGLGPSVSSGIGFEPGTYDLSESGPAGYTASAWVCVGGGSQVANTITLDFGQSATCTITNDDAAPSLTLIKAVVNNNGGSAVPIDWTLTATGPSTFSGPGPSVSNDMGFEPGSYELSETGPTGYTASAWVCEGDGVQVANTITLALGEAATCTITNNDTAPSLTLEKVLTINNGGTAVEEDWTLTATGPTGFGGNGPSVSNGIGFEPGSYVLSESGPAGYAASVWVCDIVGNGIYDDVDTITLGFGASATCTIVNDDDAPSLTLVKAVTTNNGGTADPSDWILHATGPSIFSAAGPNVWSGEVFGADFKVGSYDLSESGGPGGYSASDWACVGGTQDDADTITLALGEIATCTIINDDIGPGLTLIKKVINDHGRDADPSNWTLTATGDSTFSGAGPIVSNESGFLAGTYVLTEESNQPEADHYTPTPWTCVGDGIQVDNTIELVLDDTATCTITNDDDPVTSLTLVKVVINDDGRSAVPANWTLSATGTGSTSLSGAGPSVSSELDFEFGAYDLAESGPAGYTASIWDCVIVGTGTQDDADSITLAEGDSATCTITNDDNPAPSLTLIKNVINDNGGVALPSAWTLSAAGPTPMNGSGPNVSSGGSFVPGSYDLSESGGPAGYTASAWVCDGDGTQVANTITLDFGQSATCTITNDDDAPSLTLEKVVSNNNGGLAVESDWSLAATGPTGFSGGGPSVSNGVNFEPGIYELSEIGGPGTADYTANAWVCAGEGTQVANTITLDFGQSATCTITNDDDAPSLTLVKAVTNDNGGSAVPSDWMLHATGPSTFSDAGPSAWSSIAFGADFKVGSYDLSESGGPSGYIDSAWVCEGDGIQVDSTITLALGEAATCTITNDDDAPSLTLVAAEPLNNNGGTAGATDWTLTATGPTGFNGSGPNVSSPVGFEPGIYNLSENGPANYTAGVWVCTGDGAQVANTITLAPGDAATCTISNDDNAPSLTLQKVVSNNSGGTELASAWTLNATGPTDVNGAGPSVSSDASFKVGSYELSESTGPAGYTAGAWVCDGGTQVDNTITLTLGEAATCTITNDDNAPGLTLIKEVTNNNGGSALPSAWTLQADGPGFFSGSGPIVSSGAGFKSGSYDLSESGGPTGYTASAWVCAGDGTQVNNTITLALGESATCTIVNDDDVPSLTLKKVVTNNNGGAALASAWTLDATGPTDIGGAGPIVSSGASFKMGSYNLSESTGPAGYTASAWVCDGGIQNANSITLALGESATCTITNDDDAPGLTLVKAVTNNNGGSAVPADWMLNASGPSPFSGSGPSVSNGANFKQGSYDLSESGGPSGYTASAWVCDGGIQNANTITLALGESTTCTIVNDDDAPSLTLVKAVTNNNGGSALSLAWTLNATGPTGFSGSGPDVSSGTSFSAGNYELSESGGPSGYTASAWNCEGEGTQVANTITLALGESATCTITNDDDAPSLTLVKKITNNNGGLAAPSDWTLAATGPTNLGGSGPNVSSGASFSAGSYSLSESGGPAGYTASAWNCEGEGTQVANTITLALGEAATCTVTNDDDAPVLTLVKSVNIDNGGLASPADWTLTATGPTSFSGSGPSISSLSSFDAGSYNLSESGGSDGYSASAWVCEGDGNQIDNDTITLALGDATTCTIINSDDAPSLTLVKEVTNNNGGDALPSAWTLIAAGPTGFSGSGPSVSNGASFDVGTYDLSESGGPDGYSASDWVCDGGIQDDTDTITLALGDDATCTIINDDAGPGLTLKKVVTNDNGGNAPPSAWTLTATGPTGFSGSGPSVSNGTDFKHGTYDLSEGGGPEGYNASTWICDGEGTQIDDDTIVLALGEAATCTITNDDDVPGLTLIKAVTNNNGGSALPVDWTLHATGPTDISGVGPSVSSGTDFKAGSYDLSESGGPDGYSASAWVCIGGTQDDADTITLDLGESATCTITNDDSDSTSLTLVKKVSNNGSGSALPSAWTLTAIGPSGFNGSGPNVTSGADFIVGRYDLSESGGPSGYSASAWACVGGTQNDKDTITLALGETVTCTITNTDTNVGEEIFKDSFEQ